MGLFDRKRAEAPPPPSPESDSRPQPKVEPEPTPREPPKKSISVAPASESRSGGYGIQNAIELMRKLPADNVALVVEVVKKTLESLNVDINGIIIDAERKQNRIDDRVGKLNAEIRDYEEEIAARKQEISALTADREETRTVRERLELAQKGKQAELVGKDIPPPGASRATPMPRSASAFGSGVRPSPGPSHPGMDKDKDKGVDKADEESDDDASSSTVQKQA
jgi:hypothetical protein